MANAVRSNCIRGSVQDRSTFHALNLPAPPPCQVLATGRGGKWGGEEGAEGMSGTVGPLWWYGDNQEENEVGWREPVREEGTVGKL